MRESKFVRALREAKIFFPHHLLEDNEVLLEYQSLPTWAARGIFVHKRGFQYKGHWRSGGAKWFAPDEWPKAYRFARKESPGVEWVRSPFNSSTWIPVEAYRRACELVGKKMPAKMQTLGEWIREHGHDKS